MLFIIHIYCVAGAEFLTTNTYQASIEGFQKYLDLNYEQSVELIKKSVQICRQAIAEENLGITLNIYIYLYGDINNI